MNNPKYYLTLEQKAEKKARLDELINHDIPTNAEEIEIAKAQGDLSENAEYDAAKENHARLHMEKAELENLLNNAIIIQANTSNEVVEVGHFVHVKWSDGKAEKFQLLGFGNGKNSISIDSPLGKSLLGKKADDSVSIDAPVGRLQLKILSITIE